MLQFRRELFRKEKKNGERKGGKYPGLGKTGAMQLLWIMIAFQKGNRRKRTEKEKVENFCLNEEKKN